MPHSNPRYVFVYGTLRAGDDNDITCQTPAPVFIGHAHIQGTMYHLGAYPGLVLAGSALVVGEVYAISPALEQVLDGIEMIYPVPTGEYLKRTVPVQVADRVLECIVYEINPDYTQGKPVLVGGDWVRGRHLLG
jgi:gamma-glutamylcyclotransferase (GGCT)/AIG2-like uncharacterized protein YtfP